MDKLRILTGNANPELAYKISEYLGIKLAKARVNQFSDGEIQVSIDESVRGMDTFVVQSTCPPVNHNLMELLIMVDALKRASAGRITVVMPYYGYARQDRKVHSPNVDLGAACCQPCNRGGCIEDTGNGPSCRSDPGFF